jgi:hypothetical protein
LQGTPFWRILGCWRVGKKNASASQS